jgi:alpha-tubulin suppressor-like RCC1 family protein
MKKSFCKILEFSDSYKEKPKIIEKKDVKNIQMTNYHNYYHTQNNLFQDNKLISKNVKDFSVGEHHVIFRKFDDNKLYGYGDNKKNQISELNHESFETPVEISFFNDKKIISYLAVHGSTFVYCNSKKNVLYSCKKI